MSEDSSDSKPKKHLVPWGPLAAVVGTIITYVASQFLVGVLFGFVFGALGWSQLRIDTWLETTFAQFLIMAASSLISLLVLKLFLDTRKAGFRVLGFGRSPQWQDAAAISIGFAAYFGLLILASIFASGIGVNTEQEQEVGFEAAKHSGDLLILVFVSLVVLPPIVEEMIFRGLLFGGLRTKLNLLTATIIASTMFAIPHLFGSSTGLLWIAALDTFVLSLVLCYVREKTGALWASIGIHAIKNGLAFVFLFVAVQ